MRKRNVMLVLILPAVLAGCSSDPSAAADSPLTPAEFIDVVVDIREAEREVAENSDSAAQLFHDRRQEVLDRHGTTEAEVRAFLTTNAENLPLLELVWDTINARLMYTPPELEAAGGEEESDEAVDQEEPDVVPPDPVRRSPPPARNEARRPDIR